MDTQTLVQQLDELRAKCLASDAKVNALQKAQQDAEFAAGEASRATAAAHVEMSGLRQSLRRLMLEYLDTRDA